MGRNGRQFLVAPPYFSTLLLCFRWQKKWVKFDPYLKITPRMTVRRSCDCPITLVLHDFFPQSSHFNLLETDGDCCSAPKPENSKESVFVDLLDPFAYMDELISSQATTPTVLVSNPVENKTSSMLETVQPTVEKCNNMNMDKKSRKPTIPKLPQQSKTFYAHEINALVVYALVVVRQFLRSF